MAYDSLTFSSLRQAVNVKMTMSLTLFESLANQHQKNEFSPVFRPVFQSFSENFDIEIIPLLISFLVVYIFRTITIPVLVQSLKSSNAKLG